MAIADYSNRVMWGFERFSLVQSHLPKVNKFMIEKIATAAVYVTNQKAAIRFWGEQVGFEIRRDLPMGSESRWIEMAPPGADSCIVIYPKR